MVGQTVVVQVRPRNPSALWPGLVKPFPTGNLEVIINVSLVDLVSASFAFSVVLVSLHKGAGEKPIEANKQHKVFVSSHSEVKS